MTVAIDVQSVYKRFGLLEVLRDVSFTLPQSESVAVLGPSGCGKTTLLRILLGLEHADSGTVSGVLDRAGYLPQGSLLLPWKRVLANLELPLLLRGVARRERRDRALAHLEAFGLDRFASAYPHELSGGMQQRAALLRAVLAGAHTLILDEPFGALDTVTRQRLQQWLFRVVDRHHLSMVFVTHDPEEAVVLADDILVLGERPASVVARFRPGLSSAERLDRRSAAFLETRESLISLINPEEADE